MAMVSVVLGIARLFADLGVNSAFVQSRDVTEEQRSSLFWLNVSMSGGLTVLVVILSPVFAALFGDSRLTPLIMLSATTFVLGALGQQVKMAAEKELQFKTVVILDLVAAALGFGTAVSAALAGWGVYALVASGIVATASASAGYWIFVADGWRPMLRLRMEDVRPFVGFGSAVVANNMVNYVNRTVDVMLGGRLLGGTELGLYSVPRNLVLELSGLVNAVITRVGFPVIAQVQANVKQVRAIYLKTINMTAATNAPLYVGIAFFAPDIVAILLGEGWERSGALLRTLALWGGIRSTLNPVGSLLYGMGRASLALKWNMVLLFVVPPAVWAGSQYGPEGMALALLLMQASLFIPSWYFLVRPLCRAKLVEYSVAALRPFALSGLAVAPAFWIASQVDGHIGRLAIGIALAAPLYAGLSYLINREWLGAMMEVLGYPMAVSKR